MSIIDTSRRQTAVYWALQGEESGGFDYDGYGKPLYTVPLEILVRWEDKNEEIVLPDGTTFISRARVYTGIDISVDAVLFLGELIDVTDLNSPLENSAAWSVRRFDKLPNLKNTKTLRTAYL